MSKEWSSLVNLKGSNKRINRSARIEFLIVEPVFAAHPVILIVRPFRLRDGESMLGLQMTSSTYFQFGCFSTHRALPLVHLPATGSYFVEGAWSAAGRSGRPDADLSKQRYRLNKRQPVAMLLLGERSMAVVELVRGARQAMQHRQQTATVRKICQSRQAEKQGQKEGCGIEAVG